MNSIKPQINFFQLTDKGPVRENNEDAVASYQYEDGVLMIVADGLGAHNAGEVASTIAIEVMEREMSLAAGPVLSMKNLRHAIQQANLDVYQKAITVPELYHMGTAVIASAITGSTLFTAHIGDCRLYMLRNGVFTQLTKDHTWVGERVQYGILTPEEARTHPNRHMLTRYLGYELLASIDFLKIDVRAGDILLQCSDGAYEALLDPELAEIVRSNKPEQSCTSIVRRSRDAGAEDNISVQVVSVVTPGTAIEQPSWWRFWWR
ncbi:MAG: protein phosphatase 2C domain-containing protein [Deltaproteobacteria bacterium]|nr:protein phosphatase 2C domain-containing protein [Deltaproteobacteria bacterium]MCL5791641.1 protein phosphatase 2C domain-containing protein [Deltaproteobacteria bacterium]